MNWEILVLGDGAYVNAVLNAVSSINSYGMLGALGAMIGLLVMGFSGMAGKNGPSIEPVWIFLSVVVFSIMFLPRVDRVVIVELMVQPGGVGPRTFVVDNVPFGLAAVGYTVSRLGNGVSGIYDTSFGSATDEERARTGGLGSNLQRIGWIRTMLNDPGFTDRSGNLARHRANLINYIHACTLQGVNQNRITAASVYYRPGYEGLAYQTEARYIEYTDRNGNVTQPSCREAFDLLNAYVDTHLRADFDRALSDRFPADQSPPSSTEIVRAFAEFGYDVSNNIQIMLASQLVNAVAHQAAATGPLSTMEVAQTIMIEEAAARRASQMSAEETLFVRILRPTVSFFEALFYALAPIMAFLVATGQFGWKLTSKYLALTIWVILWFPMMAVIQLYSNVKFDYFMRRLGSDELLTPAGVHALSMEAIEHLTAAAALTAATPALAMSLIYGGAVSMSYLAGRLQGGDMTDEGLTGGKAMTQAPVLQQMAAGSASLQGGVELGGGAVPSFSRREEATATLEQARQAQIQSSEQFQRALANSVVANQGFTVNGQTAEGATQGTQTSAAYHDALSKAESSGIVSSSQMSALSKYGDQVRVFAGVGGSYFGFSAGMDASAMRSEEFAEAQSALRALNSTLQRDEGMRNQFTEAKAHDVSASISSGAMQGVSAEERETLSQTASDMISASNTYSESERLANSSGVAESVNLNQAAERLRGQLPEYSQRFHSIPGVAGAYDAAYARLSDAGAGRGDALHAGAMMEALRTSSHPGAAALRADMNNSIFSMGGGAGPVDFASGQQLQSNAPALGGASQISPGDLTGPTGFDGRPVTREGVSTAVGQGMGAAAGRIGAIGDATAASPLAGMQSQDDVALMSRWTGDQDQAYREHQESAAERSNVSVFATTLGNMSSSNWAWDSHMRDSPQRYGAEAHEDFPTYREVTMAAAGIARAEQLAELTGTAYDGPSLESFTAQHAGSLAPAVTQNARALANADDQVARARLEAGQITDADLHNIKTVQAVAPAWGRGNLDSGFAHRPVTIELGHRPR